MKRVFAHIGFSIATTLVVLNLIDIAYIPIILMGLVVIFATSLILQKYRQALTVPVCVMSAIFACIVFLGVYNGDAKPQLQLDGKEANASFYIVDLPKQNGDSYTYTVKTTQIDCDNSPQNIKLRVYSDEKLKVQPYQILNGNLKFNSLADNAFDSYGYWADDVFLSCSLDGYEATRQNVFSLNKYVLELRQNIIDVLSFHLLGDNGALAIALAIGDMSFLSDDAYNDFKLTGTTHIMAVSGMHLVVIISVLYFVMKRLNVNSVIRISVTFATIIFYVALAGFAKSIVRAGIMTCVMLIGELFKRRSDALNSLGFAVTLICLNPFAVCDLGGMLSVIAVLAIVTLYRSLDNKIFKIEYFNKPIVKSIISNVLITLAVMLYSVPILYSYFGYVSVISVVANVVLVPIGSFALIMSILAYLTSLMGVVGIPFVFITKITTQIMLDITDYFALSKLTLLGFGEHFYVVLAACFIIVAIAYLTKNKNNVKIATCVVVCLLTGTMIVSNIAVFNNDNNVLICKDGAAVITSDSTTVVVGVNSKDDFYSVSNYLFKNRLDADIIVMTDNKQEYYSAIAQDYNCQMFVMATHNGSTVYELPPIDIVQTDYQQFVVSDDLTFTFSADKNYNFTADINGISLSMDDTNADIMIDKGFVKDCAGDIDLSHGNVVYYLRNNNEFSVRRVN